MQKNEIIKTEDIVYDIFDYILPVLIYKEKHDNLLISKSKISFLFKKCRKCLIVTSEKHNNFKNLSHSWRSLMRESDWTEEDMDQRMMIVKILDGFDDKLYEYVKYNIVWSEKYPYKKEGFKKCLFLDQNKDSSQWDYLYNVEPKLS